MERPQLVAPLKRVGETRQQNEDAQGEGMDVAVKIGRYARGALLPQMSGIERIMN